MTLADAWRAKKKQGIAVGDPPTGGRSRTCLGSREGLGVEVEAVERADERELGDPQAHLDPPFLAVTHLGLTQEVERIAHREITPADFIEQIVESVAHRLQAEARQHAGEVIGSRAHQPPPTARSYSVSGRSNSPSGRAAGTGAAGVPRSLATMPIRCAASITRSRRPRRSA